MKNLQNMHPLRVIAECTLVDEVILRIGGLGLCTKAVVLLISQINYQLLGQHIDELVVTLQSAGCTSGVAIRHLAPLFTYEELWTGVLLCGMSGH